MLIFDNTKEFIVQWLTPKWVEMSYFGRGCKYYRQAFYTKEEARDFLYLLDSSCEPVLLIKHQDY